MENKEKETPRTSKDIFPESKRQELIDKVIAFDDLLNALIAAEEDGELKDKELISKDQEIERLKGLIAEVKALIKLNL